LIGFTHPESTRVAARDAIIVRNMESDFME
jgi:hypothetical protein